MDSGATSYMIELIGIFGMLGIISIAAISDESYISEHWFARGKT